MLMTSTSLSKKKISKLGFGMLGMVILIILVSLGGAIVFVLTAPRNSSKSNQETQRKALILRTAITAYKMSHGGSAGTNPPTLDSLVTDDAVACAMNNTPASAVYLTLQGWCGPYVDRELSNNLTDFKTDGWGTTFQYSNVTNIITSCGVDRTCGNGDDLTFTP
jgi:type II secretory pathway pseudopilin PulG